MAVNIGQIVDEKFVVDPNQSSIYRKLIFSLANVLADLNPLDNFLLTADKLKLMTFLSVSKSR